MKDLIRLGFRALRVVAVLGLVLTISQSGFAQRGSITAPVDPEIEASSRHNLDVGRQYRALEPAHELAKEWRRASSDAEGARELLAEDEDPETRMTSTAEASASSATSQTTLSTGRSIGLP